MLNAKRDQDMVQRKFMAALQGIDLDDDSEKEDITALNGYRAAQSGFGIGMGIGYAEEGEVA